MEKKLKKKLEESEIRYRRLFETARDGIILLNFETGQITDINPFLEQLLGYSKKEFLGKKFWEIGVFKNIKLSQEYFKILKEKGYLRYENLPLEAKDGRHIEVEFVSNVYLEGGSKVIQCNIRDVSERRRIESDIEAQRALDVEKSRNIFITDATHEFRTPLAIIKGNIDLGLRVKVMDHTSARKIFRSINKEVDYLSDLLSDLTNLTSVQFNSNSTDNKIEKVIYLENVEILGVIKSAVQRCKTLAGKKNIKIKISDSIKPIFILGDRKYLEKLFINIINNAILYGKEKGRILITGSKNDMFFKISVTDNGIGILAEDLPHVFDRFYRAQNVRLGNITGTGLGLAISKWIAESHGGSIQVASSKGRETVFDISLPLYAQ